MDPILAGAAAGVIVEGAKFLYQQAGEILTAWRAKRRGEPAAPPKVLPAPEGVTVGPADPVPEAPNAEAIDTLQELKDLVEQIKDGTVDAQDPAAREAIAELRRVVEAALRAPVTFAGEQPRPGTISDLEVVTKEVAGEVTGVRTRLGQVERVRVETGDVKPGAKVYGVRHG